MSEFRVVTVLDELGLHSRPAGRIVQLARGLAFPIRVGLPNKDSVLATSPLALMALKAKQGQQLELELETSDSSQATEIANQIQGILSGQ